MKKESGAERMNLHARSLRAEAFQQKRKTYDQLDYLQYYPEDTRNAILSSMQALIPSPLPSLSPTTISFYRRSSHPLFCPRSENKELDPHLTYQSLWILSSLEEKVFVDYQGIVREFESDFKMYLGAKSADIREMAVIVAGNKIIGKTEDIISLVRGDSHQMWVLANHVYEDKIHFRELFSWIPLGNELALKTLFQVSMFRDLEMADQILASPDTLQTILAAASSDNENVKKYALRLVGNILATREEQISDLLSNSNLLQTLYEGLNCASGEVRRDCCWVLSNACTRKNTVKIVLNSSQVMNRLVHLFSVEVIPNIQKEICLLLCCLIYYGPTPQVLEQLVHPQLLEVCYQYLGIEDDDLSVAVLNLVKQLLELNDEGKLGFELLRQNQPLCQEIIKKTYSEHNQVSSLSLQIQTRLEEEEE